MTSYIVRRLLQMIPTLLVISFMIFSLLYITPGDPVSLALGVSDTQTISPETYEKVRQDLGLDKPFGERYMNFILKAAKGDLGISYITKNDVFDEIKARMPATLQLTFAAMLLSICISMPLGILAAFKHNSIWDNLFTMLATIGVSLPKFWFALVLIIVFSLNLGFLPSKGIGYMSDGFSSVVAHLILPASSLALGLAATQTRMIRSSMLEVLNQDYIKFARSKGLKEKAVILGHALKNSMIPVITVLGSELGSLLGGAVVTETIFAWPGVGRLIVNAIGRRDYPTIQGATLVLCVTFLAINLIVDLCYALINPKIRIEEN